MIADGNIEENVCIRHYFDNSINNKSDLEHYYITLTLLLVKTPVGHRETYLTQEKEKYIYKNKNSFVVLYSLFNSRNKTLADCCKDEDGDCDKRLKIFVQLCSRMIDFDVEY